ncbi:MAG: hypothetical protein DLM65_08680 [Candidatus Aeolococcus gillhamiae]|uniref:Uncharacterized protein n=1 Tax=Candidatus Aeolococcus gillhamiae TaxID=3127015 RepID=A0A2W6A4E2_9BACT|nr:MAG: hypothetical protein DLM65_08680 [Candidatus Dormibacter sp. RRmetagenome_bin12]
MVTVQPTHHRFGGIRVEDHLEPFLGDPTPCERLEHRRLGTSVGTTLGRAGSGRLGTSAVNTEAQSLQYCSGLMSGEVGAIEPRDNRQRLFWGEPPPIDHGVVLVDRFWVHAGKRQLNLRVFQIEVVAGNPGGAHPMFSLLGTY